MYYSYVEIEYVATGFSPARLDLALKLLKIKQIKHREDQINLLNNVSYASTRETLSNML